MSLEQHIREYHSDKESGPDFVERHKLLHQWLIMRKKHYHDGTNYDGEMRFKR